MAIEFTKKLILFSSTANNYIEKYHQLNASFTTKKREHNLQAIFKDIRVVISELRTLQLNLTEQFGAEKDKLSKKWRRFGRALISYLEAIVEHTYAMDELIKYLEPTSFLTRVMSINKTLKVLRKIENISKICTDKEDTLNELIYTGKYNV